VSRVLFVGARPCSRLHDLVCRPRSDLGRARRCASLFPQFRHQPHHIHVAYSAISPAAAAADGQTAPAVSHAQVLYGRGHLVVNVRCGRHLKTKRGQCGFLSKYAAAASQKKIKGHTAVMREPEKCCCQLLQSRSPRCH
jgi:hypothetical protein